MLELQIYKIIKEPKNQFTNNLNHSKNTEYHKKDKFSLKFEKVEKNCGGKKFKIVVLTQKPIENSLLSRKYHKEFKVLKSNVSFTCNFNFNRTFFFITKICMEKHFGVFFFWFATSSIAKQATLLIQSINLMKLN